MKCHSKRVPWTTWYIVGQYCHYSRLLNQNLRKRDWNIRWAMNVIHVHVVRKWQGFPLMLDHIISFLIRCYQVNIKCHNAHDMCSGDIVGCCRVQIIITIILNSLFWAGVTIKDSNYFPTTLYGATSGWNMEEMGLVRQCHASVELHSQILIICMRWQYVIRWHLEITLYQIYCRICRTNIGV